MHHNVPMTLPLDLLTALQREPGRPRITVYDDTEGPTRGERIELSGRVLANWVAKAANLLVDEVDLQPGDRARLALPPHWRTVYWALAVWATGATLTLDEDPGAVVVITDDPRAAQAADQGVLVTLAALARSAAVPVPPGVLDEAAVLATYPDALPAMAQPTLTDTALSHDGQLTVYGDLVLEPQWDNGIRVHILALTTADLLRTCLTAWACDGSVVLSRGSTDPAVLARRLTSEGAVSAPSASRPPAR